MSLEGWETADYSPEEQYSTGAEPRREAGKRCPDPPQRTGGWMFSTIAMSVYCDPKSLDFNAFDTAADLEWTCSFS